MNKIIIFAIFLFSAMTVSAQKNDAETEACKVYEAVLTEKKKPFVILDSIRGETFGRNWTFSKKNPQFAVVQAETLKSYKKDSYWCDIKDFVNFETKKTLISHDEAQSYFEKLKTDDRADMAFIEKYQTENYYIFSNVGFNKNRDQALLTIGWQSISFRGYDVSYVVLSKTNGAWKVIDKQVIWAS